MSDYEVNLVNDNMQEFYVRFFGPAESTSSDLLLDRSLPDLMAAFSLPAPGFHLNFPGIGFNTPL